jgi:hypothetical protein
MTSVHCLNVVVYGHVHSMKLDGSRIDTRIVIEAERASGSLDEPPVIQLSLTQAEARNCVPGSKVTMRITIESEQ